MSTRSVSLVSLKLLIILLISQFSPVLSKKFVSESPLGVYRRAAVSANGYECAEIGSNILKKGGSAVDAAIAATLCDGIACPHSMGIGGGFLMTIYDATSGEATFLDARESAPALASVNMFKGNANLSVYGGLAVAVPGEIMGYWEAHQRYGQLPWIKLFEPSIELSKIGSHVTQYVEDSLKDVEDHIKKEPTLAEIFINPTTNELYVKGDKIKRAILAEILQELAEAENPVDLFYHGEIADKLVQELNEFGGIITKEDFENYQVKWKKPIEIKVGNMTMYTAPPPGSGALVAFMINVLQDFLPENNEQVMWQRIVETFKWAYAKRTELGDPDFVDVENLVDKLTSKTYAKAIRNLIKDDKTYNKPKDYGAVTFSKDDHGTGNVCVLAPDGSAVSITSTINLILGAKIRSKSTGIIFNDEMDDFSSPNIINRFNLPPSPANFIVPGKRPQSSMSPTIVVNDKKNVKLVVGGSGGSKITTAVATIVTLNLLKGYDIKEAVDARRLHHQLIPMEVQYEEEFSPETLTYLNKVGHTTTTFYGMGNAITAIATDNFRVTANSDHRREGTISGF